MNSKINPWMVTTILLVGIIIGFGIGKIVPNNTTSTIFAAAQTGGNTVATANGGGNTANSQQLPSLQTATTINYGNVEKSFENGHYGLGNKNAKVKIIDYSDYQCPFCDRYFSQTFQQILTDYVATGKVYYTFYSYPLDIHPQGQKAAGAALCVARAGRAGPACHGRGGAAR